MLTDRVTDYNVYRDLHAAFSTIGLSIEPNWLTWLRWLARMGGVADSCLRTCIFPLNISRLVFIITTITTAAAATTYTYL